MDGVVPLSQTGCGATKQNRRANTSVPSHSSDVRSESARDLGNWLRDRVEDAMFMWHMIRGYREGRRHGKQKRERATDVAEESSTIPKEGS